tara:strand:- start:1142 stop:2308 length:1167 start_codon:yes stop_codon:yes gene_type:complete
MALDYTDIDEVINDFQLMIDDTSYDKEAKVYQLKLLALQGLRELKFDAEQEVKTTTFVIDSTTLQCTLPSDYVKLLRVGYKNDEGDFVPLGNNPDLSLDASVASQVNNDPYDENNPYYHVDLGKKFGVGGGKNSLGYYRLNRNDNTVNFSSDVAGKTVFLEYISDGVSYEMPRDHVIRLKFNGADSDSEFKIVNGSVLRIPKVNDSSGHEQFTFATTQTTTASTSIFFVEGDDATTIAERFSTLINEGYPTYRVNPYNTNLTASQIGNEVTLTYNNSTVVPLSVTNSIFSTNNSTSLTYRALVSDMELVQLGVAGSVPRVHKFCEEALRCYIYYKYIQRKRGIPANEKQMAKRAYYNEKRLARARMMNFSKETAMQTSRKAFKQSPKL